MDLIGNERDHFIDDMESDILMTFLHKLPNLDCKNVPFSKVLSRCAVTFGKVGRLEQARLMARRTLLLDEKDMAARLVLGRCGVVAIDAVKQKKLGDAMEDYYAVEEAISSLKQVGVDLGLLQPAPLLRKRKNTDVSDRAEATKRTRTESGNNQISAKIDSDDPKTAETLDNFCGLTQSRDIKAEALSNLALLQFKKGHVDASVKLYEEAFKLSP
ncbi:hypothetical protein HDU67_005413, partial [Dinochytrium kinnereticum]